ncbi:hypothetical protein BGX30_000624, partial [Mortierella sp. GBA39]
MAATTTPISRSITKSVLSREQSKGVGARVHRSIGRPELRNHDPFFMLDEFSVDKNGGFPDHPHRGFETVTYMLEGQFQHEDFAGHKGTIGPGDLKWMTAGRGIVHSEMQELFDGHIPRVTPQDGVVVKIIAGESHGVKSQVYTRTSTMYLHFKMDKNKTVTQTIPETYNGFVYVLSGTAYIGGANSETETKPHYTLIFFEDRASTVRILTKDEAAHFVLIAGEPLREPVVQIGPFVMNTPKD